MATEAQDGPAAVDAAIAALDDWRGERLAMIRELVLHAVPDAVEGVKWRKPSNPLGVPTWEQDGILCTGEAYAGKVKLTFAHGASLEDPTGLFNSSLGGKTRRAIDISEDDQVDQGALADLFRAAADHNAMRTP